MPGRRALLRFIVPAATLSLSMFGQAAAAPDDWKLLSIRNGIEVFSRSVPGSAIRAVRGVMRVNARQSALVALLRDHEARPAWESLCAGARVQQALSETEEIVYLHYDLPWPVADRDMVMRVSWSQDADSRASMQAIAIEGVVPPTPGRVRVTKASSTWTFAPLEDGAIEVSVVAHLDPGGPLPAWLLNFLAADAPLDSLNSFRRLVAEDRHASSEGA